MVPQLTAEDVANAVWYAIDAPSHVQVFSFSKLKKSVIKSVMFKKSVNVIKYYYYNSRV